jgi:hypothetical protein
MLRQAVRGELEHRVGPQTVGVVAVLAARGDHPRAEANDLIEPVHDTLRRARVADAGGEAPGDAQAPLDLAQRQQAAVRGHQLPIKACLDGLAADR